METDEEVLLINIIFSSCTESESEERALPRQKKRKRKMWVRDFYKQRDQLGAHTTIVKTLSVNDPILFRNYMRMTPEQFENLLGIVGPYINKENCIRKAISPSERLALTIRYLASGDSQRSIAFAYLCSPSTVHKIVKETTRIIWDKLKGEVFDKFTKDSFKAIANGFASQWQFPNCLGAIDGKHIQIQAPSKSGSTFYNYKKTHSIVLLAICDANYLFTMCDIGAAGRQSDGGIFRHCEFGKAFSSQQLDIPRPSAISLRHTVPYVFIADDAFPLGENMMKPFNKANLTITERIFNYRLSRARRIIENSFGILTSKWRIFRKPILAEVSTVENITGACVCLHNWLRNQQNEFITPGLVDVEQLDGSIVPGSWRQEESALGSFKPNVYNSTIGAKNVRASFADYFMTEGALPWQMSKI